MFTESQLRARLRLIDDAGEANPEVCVHCGVDHKTCNEWHIHHHNQIICEKHFNSGFTENDLELIRVMDQRQSPHPEWFPKMRKNIGAKTYMAALDLMRPELEERRL